MILRWFGRKKPEEQARKDETTALLPEAVPAEPAPPEPVAEEPPAPEPVPEPELPPPPAVETPPPPPIAPPSEPEERKDTPEIVRDDLPAALTAEEEKPKKGWFARLKDGLSKSSSKLTEGISGIFTKRKLDDEALEELEELLITADLGPTTAAKVTAELARTRFGKEVSPEEVKATLAAEVAKIVGPVAKPLEIDATL
ncbi:signal recognition particle receptor subunit alpha, partial [Azospirillum brasilense]|uniref:signal recognition particle receptor subunit alpha n=1 Tax=Azospirillum brasilense TaxID=192 RepID=UPI0005588798